MTQRIVILDIVGLTPDVLKRSDLAPNLASLADAGATARVRPSFPAVTCTAQATLTTGTLPREHGVVANGWFDRVRHAVEFWEQPSGLVEAPRVWDRLKSRDPDAKAASLFLQQSMHGTADVVMTPRPIHLEGGMVQWVHSKPVGMYEGLVPDVGAFDLKDYWGPLAGEKSSRWIANAAARVLDAERPTLSFVYLPHLDYDHLRHGPSSPEAEQAIRTVDEIVGALVKDLRARGVLDDALLGLVGEYAFRDVSLPVHPNRLLRDAGLLAVREIGGHEYLDTEMSRAFAVSDHQVSHVYCKPDAIDAARSALSGAEGVAEVLDDKGKTRLGLDHPRSGELVLVAEPAAWFTYYYWQDDALAPPFARTVDIHRKPGFDPVELFVDPRTRSIPLDASLVLVGDGAGEAAAGGLLDLARVPERLLAALGKTSGAGRR